MTDLEQLRKCTKRKSINYGQTTIECKLGLWCVTAPDKKSAEREAMHYFLQYRDDGEYSSIIGGKSVIEKCMGR